MNIPPGSRANRREAQELANRFSALSTEISACLDAVLGELQRAPNNERAVGVARDLVAAQRAVTQQLLTLSLASGQESPRALYSAEQRPTRLLPAPSPIEPASGGDLFVARDEYSGGQAGASLLHLLQTHTAQPQEEWQPEPAHQPVAQTWTSNAASAFAPPQALMSAEPDAAWQYRDPMPDAIPLRYAAAGVPAQSYERPMQVAATAPPASSKRQARSSPHAIARMLGTANRSSPLRLAAVVLPMVVVLSLMLNVAQRPSKPEAAREDGPSQALVDAQAARKAQDPVEPAPEGVAAEPANLVYEAGSAQAAEVVAPAKPAAQQIAGTLITPLPVTQSQEASAEQPDARMERAELPSAARPAEKVLTAVTPAKTATAALDEPKSTRLAAVAPVPRAQPAQVKPIASAVEKPAPEKTKIEPFKTAVVKAEPAQEFAPVLIELKNKDSLQRIFGDLQKRYPGSLGTKHAELRPVAGPDNETWFALVAAPGGAKADADAICRTLGPEGKALGCRVIRY